MRLGLLVLGAAALLSDTAHARRAVPFNLLRASRRTRGADAGPLDALPRSGPASPPINITDTAKHLSVQELLVLERLFVLLQRMSAGALVALGAAASRLLNYPPRVVTVHLRGVIASEEEMRAAMRADSEAPAMAHADGLGRFAPFDARAGDLINLQRFDRALNKAFATPGARAVVLVIDSPGGSPAQSSLLYRRLRLMRKRHPKLPLLAFVEDSACSGGYYVACAADEIIVDPNSLVGSIGVIARGFGYVKKLKKVRSRAHLGKISGTSRRIPPLARARGLTLPRILCRAQDGLERRVQTSGTAKGGLDPFLPMRKGDLKQQRRLLTELHTNFVAAVKEARARCAPRYAGREALLTSAHVAGARRPPPARARGCDALQHDARRGVLRKPARLRAERAKGAIARRIGRGPLRRIRVHRDDRGGRWARRRSGRVPHRAAAPVRPIRGDHEDRARPADRLLEAAALALLSRAEIALSSRRDCGTAAGVAIARQRRP